jgi:hypothetical protein
MEKIKQFIESEKGKDIMIVIIVILVGLGSFELGRLSKSNDSTGVKILPAQAGEYPKENLSQGGDLTANAIYSQNLLSANINTSKSILNSNNKNFFASNKGTKYYSIGCSAGKTIKRENRVYFMTKEEAEQAGYELSSSCK